MALHLGTTLAERLFPYQGPLSIVVVDYGRNDSGMHHIFRMSLCCYHYPVNPYVIQTIIDEMLLANRADLIDIVRLQFREPLESALIAWDMTHDCDCLDRTNFGKTGSQFFGAIQWDG